MLNDTYDTYKFDRIGGLQISREVKWPFEFIKVTGLQTRYMLTLYAQHNIFWEYRKLASDSEWWDVFSILRKVKSAKSLVQIL